jgi:S1-C subfamily serine protease
MRRISAAIIGLLFFIAPVLAFDSWNPIAEKVQKSLAFLAVGSMGSCTAFVINEKENYVLSANHCFGTEVEGKDLLVDNSPAKLVARDQKHDLMVLFVKGLDKPALHLAKNDPKIGDQVASYGYGLGLERPLFRVAYISDNDTTIDGSGLPDHLIAVDAQFVPGQSGGPVVNQVGDVVMMVEAGGQGVGLGPGAETIKGHMGRYFEAKPKEIK